MYLFANIIQALFSITHKKLGVYLYTEPYCKDTVFLVEVGKIPHQVHHDIMPPSSILQHRTDYNYSNLQQHSQSLDFTMETTLPLFPLKTHLMVLVSNQLIRGPQRSLLWYQLILFLLKKKAGKRLDKLSLLVLSTYIHCRFKYQPKY